MTSVLSRLEKEDALVRPIIASAMKEIDTSLTLGPADFRPKWGAIQKELKNRGFDVGYAAGSELDRSDASWFTACYYPQIERFGVFIATSGRPLVVAGSEGGHVLEESVENSGAGIALFRPFQISDEEYLGVEWRDLDSILREVTGGRKVKKVAILTPADITPHSQVELLTRKFGAANVKFVPEILQHLKYEKTPKELLIMKQANIVVDAAMRGMLAVLRPGLTELQVASVGDRIMKYLGAARTGFVTIVTSGERNYTVIGGASNRVIRQGDMVALGVSPTFNGYHGIIRRSVKVGGNYNADQAKMMDVVEGLYHTVMKATIEAVRKNLPSNTIDQKGREYLKGITFRARDGSLIPATDLPPYTFIHNTGTSECQEGYGAVTPYTTHPLGRRVALMIDVALKGFKERGKPLFHDALYVVIEDAFWVMDGKVGVYNKLPLRVDDLVGNNKPLGRNINPYYRELR